MDRSVLIPLGVGFVFVLLALIVISTMPETLHKMHGVTDSDTPPVEARPVSQDVEGELATDSTALVTPESPAARPESRHRAANNPSMLYQTNILVGLAVLFIGALRPAVVATLFQYAATRFGSPLAQTAMMISEIAVVNIVLFLFVVPQCIAWVSTRYELEAQTIDYTIVFVSLMVLASGAFLMAVAPSITLLHIGWSLLVSSFRKGACSVIENPDGLTPHIL